MNLCPLAWSEVQQHIARYVATCLAGTLQSASEGYRLALTDLAPELMIGIAKQLCDAGLSKGTRVVVVGETEDAEWTVSPTRLVELRNDEDNVPFLVALIPTRFRSYAEDSYAEHNFAVVDPEPILLQQCEGILEQFADQGFPEAMTIVRRAQGATIEAKIRYLLSVKSVELDWQIFGAFLPLLGLAPDLELEPANLAPRLLDNANKVAVLTDPTRPLVERIERLKIGRENIQTGLLRLLSRHDPQNVEAWGQAIVEEALVLKAQKRQEARLSYDNWMESRDSGPHCDLEVLPLSKDNPIDEAGQVNITTEGKIKVRWRWECTPPQEVRFIARGYRDEEELFSSGSIPFRQRTKTINLRSKGVDEGHGQIQMEAISPEGRVLAVAESEPFWIVGEEESEFEMVGAREPKWGDEVRSLAEAYCLAAMKLGREITPQEVLWQSRSRRGPIDTLKIRYSRGTVYHVRLSPILREFEQTVLLNPQMIGLWHHQQTDPGSNEATYEPVSMDLGTLPDAVYKGFREARDKLFEQLRSQKPEGVSAAFCNVVETADLLALRTHVIDYVRAYTLMLHHYTKAQEALSLLRALALDALVRDDEVILSPLHPLKLAWAIQYQELLSMLRAAAAKEGRRQAKPDRTLFQLLTSINYPPFTPGPDGEMRVNAGQLHLLWSTFSTDPTQYRRIADRLKGVLGVVGSESEEALDPQGLAQRINRYLQLHPFIRQLKMGVVNPGDGATFLDVVRTLEREWGSSSLKYDLAFFAQEEPERSATALDRLMTEEDESKRRTEDDELVESHSSLMSPKLVYAKHALETYYQSDIPFQYHILVLLDTFKTKIGSLESRPQRSASFLGHLFNDLVSDFEASSRYVSWAHTVVPCSEPDVAELKALAPLLAESLEAYMRACGFLLSASPDAWPAVYLPIREQERKLIVLAHQRADWVVFLDKFFDVDFIDHPNSPFCEYYLVDYVPSGHAGMGHKLIVSTASTVELQRLVARELASMDLPIEAAPDVVDALQAMSGRLALKQLTTKNLVREAIGLSLLWMKLQETGELSNAVFIPIDPHPELLRKGITRADAEPSQRTDAILVALEPEASALHITLIESKLRTSVGAGAFLQLKGHIADQLERTRKDVVMLLGPEEKIPSVSRLMNWQDFKAVALFYLERACRHHIVSDELVASWRSALGMSPVLDMGLHFKKEAYVFNLSFSGQEEEMVSPNIHIHHIGRDEILRLLSSEANEEERGLQVELEQPSVAVRVDVSVSDKAEDVEGPEQVTEPDTATDAGAKKSEPEYEPQDVSVYLGEGVYDHQEVCWEPLRTEPRRLTNPHVLIVGTSGAGKTQTTMAFLHELWQHKVPALILDFHGEYANPDGVAFRDRVQAQVINALDGIPVNPLEIPLDPYRRPVNPKRVVWEVSEIIGRIFRVGLQQQRALKRAIQKAYQLAGFTSDPKTWSRRAPSFSTIQGILGEEELTGGNVVATLLSRLDVLFDADVFSDQPSQSLDDLLRHTSVIDLSRLFNNEHRLVVARFFLQKIYNQMLMLGESRDLRLFVTIDEAHQLSFDETLLKLIKEARKYGIGILLASQEPTDFPATALELPGTRIFLQQGPRGAKTIASHLEPTELKRRQVLEGELQSLDVGQAYIRSNHFVPFEKVQISLFYQRLEG